MAVYILVSTAVAGSLALSIWAIVDVAATPAEVFRATGSSRKKWLMLLVFFTLALDVIGVVLAITYFAMVRPKVRGPLRAA